MLQISTSLTYSVLTLLSTGKKSFENMGRLIRKSGDTVARLLQAAKISKTHCQEISKELFKDSKQLYVIIDDTLIKKFFSEVMEGSGSFFDIKIGRRINAFKLVFGMISDGKFAIPTECAYLFSKEILEHMHGKIKSKNDIAKAFVQAAMTLFPGVKIIVLADGLYATKEFLQWCYENKIAVEVRMPSNRVVLHKSQKISLKKLLQKKGIRPTGRQMARTIPVLWHDIPLEVTIERRIDKHGNESFVFQAATYKSLPREHIKAYKARWAIEKAIRTMKQHLGLGECFSTLFETQHNHVASSMLSYALAQLEMKNKRLDTPEEAIRRLKKKNVTFLIDRFSSFLAKLPDIHA